MGADRRARRGGATRPTVTVLEASARLGGPLQSADVGGRNVDVGPDGFLGRRTEALDLCNEVGLADDTRADRGTRCVGMGTRASPAAA